MKRMIVRKELTCTCNVYFLHPGVDDGHVAAAPAPRAALVVAAVGTQTTVRPLIDILVYYHIRL